MPAAILFDLDGTLLDNDMDRFMPAYLAALSRRLAPVVPSDTLISALLAATRCMMKPHDTSQTNEEVFWADFLPRLARRRDELAPLLEEFYRVDFAALRSVTTPMPGAHTAVSAAFAAGLTVGIATQPVFPLTAIEQRLQWAGVDGLPYAIVTSFETMHTTKPDPSYYRENLRAHRPGPGSMSHGRQRPRRRHPPSARCRTAHLLAHRTGSGAE